MSNHSENLLTLNKKFQSYTLSSSDSEKYKRQTPKHFPPRHHPHSGPWLLGAVPVVEGWPPAWHILSCVQTVSVTPFWIYLCGYVQGAVSLQVLHVYFFFRVQALVSVPRMPGTSAQPVLLCSAPWGRQHIFRATVQDSLSPDLSCAGVKASLHGGERTGGENPPMLFYSTQP